MTGGRQGGDIEIGAFLASGTLDDRLEARGGGRVDPAQGCMRRRQRRIDKRGTSSI
jgi:hypothetical protein